MEIDTAGWKMAILVLSIVILHEYTANMSIFYFQVVCLHTKHVGCTSKRVNPSTTPQNTPDTTPLTAGLSTGHDPTGEV